MAKAPKGRTDEERRAYQRIYRRAHKEKQREYQRLYRNKPEVIAARRKTRLERAEKRNRVKEEAAKKSGRSNSLHGCPQYSIFKRPRDKRRLEYNTSSYLRLPIEKFIRITHKVIAYEVMLKT